MNLIPLSIENVDKHNRLLRDDADLDVTIDVLPSGDIATGSGSTDDPLIKTEICHNWKTNTCKFGEKCRFAHGEHELRKILRDPRYKTVRCRQFMMTGKCKYKNRCRFLHDELRPKPMSAVQDSETLPSSAPSLPIKDKARYKTKLCKTWLKKKKCPYGPRCQFLHGYGDSYAIYAKNPDLEVSQVKPNTEESPSLVLTDVSLVDWTHKFPLSPMNSQASTCGSSSASSFVESADDFELPNPAIELSATAKEYAPESTRASTLWTDFDSLPSLDYLCITNPCDSPISLF